MVSHQGAKILVADDNETVRTLFSRDLRRHGFDVAVVEDGDDALDYLETHPVDVLLLDIDMPRLDGISVLKLVRHNPALADLHVLIVSANDDMGVIAQCIELGADDYLGKPCNSTLLHARLNACLEKKRAREIEERYLRDLQEWKARLRSELDEASNYVRGLLPMPVETPFKTSWIYQPSSELGGDVFGYHEVAPGAHAIFLLDVSGHGVGAALLSVSLANMLRGRAMHGTDFSDPSSVLASLNEAFPLQQNSDRYFTIWYGVYFPEKQILTYSSGGHPCPLWTGAGGVAPVPLSCRAPAIGLMPDTVYRTERQDTSGGGRLLVYSDGARELCDPQGREIGLDAFLKAVHSPHATGQKRLEAMLAGFREFHGSDHFEDDLSLLEVEFA